MSCCSRRSEHTISAILRIGFAKSVLILQCADARLRTLSTKAHQLVEKSEQRVAQALGRELRVPVLAEAEAAFVRVIGLPCGSKCL
jgi:hypothetical protein